jgi:hypothetical protein
LQSDISAPDQRSGNGLLASSTRRHRPGPDKGIDTAKRADGGITGPYGQVTPDPSQ